MSRTARSARALAVYGLFTAVGLLTGLVGTPLLIRYLGPEAFGAYRATSDWLGYLTLLEAGLGGAVAGAFSRAIAGGPASVTAVARAGLRLYGRTAVAAGVAVVVFAAALPYLVPASPAVVGQLRLGCGCYLIGLAVWPLNTFRWLADAAGRTVALQWLALAQAVGVFGLSMLFACSGVGVSGQLAAIAAGAVAGGIGCAALANRQFPGLLRDGLRAGAADPTLAADLGRLNRAGIVTGLAGRLVQFSDVLIVARLLGPAAVTPLFATQRLIQHCGGAAQAVGTVTWGGLAELYHRGDHAHFRQRVLDVSRLVATLTAAAVVPLAVWNDRLVSAWVGAGNYAGPAITVLVVATTSGQAILSVWAAVFAATGHPHLLTRVGVTSAVANLGVGVPATLAFGLAGPGVGGVAALAVSGVWTTRLLRDTYGISRRRLLWAVGGPLLVAAPLAAGLLVARPVIDRLPTPPGRVLTGEYPPQFGGLADYTRLVAGGLAADGAAVTVYAPPATGLTPTDAGVTVRRLPDWYGPAGLAALDRWLFARPRPDHLLVQYVPQMYGLKGLNLGFAAWLAARGRRAAPVTVMFHEVYVPLALRPWPQVPLGLATRLMARWVAGAADRVFVSIPGWHEWVLRACPRVRSSEWLPVPSNMPADAPAAAVAAVRGRYSRAGGPLVGHFGTYHPLVAPLVGPCMAAALRAVPAADGLFLGRGSDGYAAGFVSAHPDLAGRVRSAGMLSPGDVAATLRACDLLVQPYHDGVSTRRGSVMAGLANGVPVATNLGELSEPIWAMSGAVAHASCPAGAAATAAHTAALPPVERAAIGRRGAELYHQRFSLAHTVRRLAEPFR